MQQAFIQTTQQRKKNIRLGFMLFAFVVFVFAWGMYEMMHASSHL